MAERVAGRSARARLRGLRGRCCRRDRRGVRQPACAHPGALRALGDALRAHGHGAPRGRGRARAGRRRLGERRRHDPRRRQQGGGGDAPGARPPRGGRGLAGRRRADLLGERGERAQRRPGLRRLRAAAPTSASSSTTRRRSARSWWRRRPSTACTRPSAARRPTPASAPRPGAARSWPPPRPSPSMPHGRIDEETTANVGTIAGGVGGTNVVAEHCWFDAEARSLSDAAVETPRGRDGRPLQRRRQRPGRASATSTSPSSACSAPTATGPRPPAWSPPRRRCAPATTRPRRILSGGGSDANAFEANGLHCINLANGTERNHESSERVSQVALEGMLDVTFALLDELAERARRGAVRDARPARGALAQRAAQELAGRQRAAPRRRPRSRAGACSAPGARRRSPRAPIASAGASSATNAIGASPRSASGTPTTPASRTAGCWRSTSSISAGATEAPLTLMSSLRRSRISSWPSSRMATRSPVRSQPSGVRSPAVSSGRPW